MQRRTVLFTLGKDTPEAAVAAAAEAARDEQAYLACLLLDKLPGRPYFILGTSAFASAAMPEDWIDRLNAARTAAQSRAAAMADMLSRCGCAGDAQYAVCTGAEMRLHAAQRAKTCDIVQMAEGLGHDGEVFREALHGALFQSPAPVILNGSPFAAYERVFLAWNSSLAASRAAHAALPYLRKAREVIIGCFDPDITEQRDGEDPGTDAAAWLSHHGCTVTVSQYPDSGAEIGRFILARAKEAGAGLAVMGAYGHSRLREAVFGGTTRTMIEQTELPVLLAH
ncbi:universal stress protein [Leisingera aquaemixtae]|uniref:universal stress protein n=1 Tax=Leisingera aquaemixtae TaxID=1396826 RepID=UPI0021A43783|nr:universal stress protein [Leisingera aquaemixtae]UWQ48086.1 universal stress protein [Leisingera aquaemixtae]